MVPIVMQVSTAAPEQKRKAGWKRKETTGTGNAKLARVAQNVTFSMTVNGSGDVASGEISTLSAQFESLDEDKGEAEDVGSSDGSGSSPNQSEEESENMEGEDAGEGENEDGEEELWGDEAVEITLDGVFEFLRQLPRPGHSFTAQRRG